MKITITGTLASLVNLEARLSNRSPEGIVNLLLTAHYNGLAEPETETSGGSPTRVTGRPRRKETKPRKHHTLDSSGKRMNRKKCPKCSRLIAARGMWKHDMYCKGKAA